MRNTRSTAVPATTSIHATTAAPAIPAAPAPAPASEPDAGTTAVPGASRRGTGRSVLPAAAAAALLLPLAGCGSASAGDGSTVTVTVGYQSKTINTVTAGTLLRSLGYFERDLKALGKQDGKTYKVVWQDYPTGAPITAQMTAGKIDIGSMGDYPLLINAARGTELRHPTRLVSVTGYNLRGGLNTVVTAPGSTIGSLAGLRGKNVSTSVGSAADGTLVRALRRAGIDPDKDIHKLNQEPAVGASALSSGSADALSQFVAWPGLLVWQDKAKALYDGAELNVPTFHGVTAVQDFAKQRPKVLNAFLRAQNEATTYLNDHPVAAAERVGKAAGLPPEVVYLYNGAGGVATFDPTIKPRLVAALKEDVAVLRSAGLVGNVDVDAFVDDHCLRTVLGRDYARRAAAAPAPARSEAWPKGAGETRAFDSPKALLGYVAHHAHAIRAAYVPDASTGTLWFANKAVWVADSGDLKAFVAPSTAHAYIAEHPGARTVSYARALERAS
ncbi:putative nitrate ABC transporter, periplasmic protein [Streptomyces sulfonofaciens]|uniref:Nitrate ABC transporter, periplasmic protein n=1 Tax=Streptomyces sulfonofaciens TaxID=68272 RepID=A0A919G515_9ACTN|nr:ABC transporter substrate-binding protein [Streptomyces sulfonofaciens]GHH78293.1 putative nitrate ABC transporter, periplasmic protein [Streptomyces sulfonofaciens]